MTPHQLYVGSVLEAVSTEPFSSEDQRELLLAIKDRIVSAPDLGNELRRLYSVGGFDEFALALMWMVKQADERADPTADDQYLVSMKFRQAFGAPEQEQAEEVEVSHEDTPPEVELPGEETPTDAATPVSTPEERAPVAFAPDAAEDTFPQLLDKFVIAMQAGVDDRTRLFDKVLQSATEIGQPDSDYSSDLQEYCAKLVGFLSYVKDNDFLDDVRTLNILSTISDAMSAWDSASIESRMGLLAEGIKALADFRNHFE